MKKIVLLTVSLTIFIMASCNQSKSTKEIASSTDNIKREGVIGSWIITEKTAQNIKNADLNPENEKVKSFTLNADSTATIVLNNSAEKISGTWTWKEEKKMGNSNFGASLKQDILITFDATKNNRYILALHPSEIKGKLFLAAESKVTYEKQ